MELQIVLEDLDPPTGHAVVDGHNAWSFAGWLELIEKIERLREEPDGSEPEPESGRAP